MSVRTDPDQQPDPTYIVAALAAESRVPVAEVTHLYEHERNDLAVGAHITRFLHIFAIRKVREILRKRAAERLVMLPTAFTPLAI